MPYYEIVIANHLDPKRLRDFNGLINRNLSNGHTLLYGMLTDQSALFSVLNRIRDMNLTLISVKKGWENDVETKNQGGKDHD